LFAAFGVAGLLAALVAGLLADFAAAFTDFPTADFFAAFLLAAVFFVVFVFVGISSL
jgi:hypothetical protein